MSSAPRPNVPLAPRTQHHLTPAQVAAFDRDGFLVLRDRIPEDLLTLLRDASTRWIDEARRTGPDDPDHRFADGPDGPRLWRLDYLHGRRDPASLVLLGAPEVLGIAESLAGLDLVPTYESLVLKDEGDGAEVAWHQDAVHPRRHRIFNVDVYLDASRSGAGALRVVRGSQRGPVDVCAVAAGGWEPEGVAEVELAPGDVLVHDVMVVHGSPATSAGAPLRRTIYLEFRSATQIAAEGPWDAEWVAARRRLLPLARRAHGRARPHAHAASAWPELTAELASLGDDDAELRIVHEVHSPGSWCSAGGVLTS